MKLSKEQQIFSIQVAKLILKADALGVGLTFGDAHRSNDQQLLYYHGYTLKANNFGLQLFKTDVKSKTLTSYHGKRLAVDFNYFIDGVLYYEHELINELGQYWESLDIKNRWGGNFKSIKDTPHYERKV